MNNSNLIGLYIVIFVLLIIPYYRRKKIRRILHKKSKKGEKRIMPVELIKEYIGKTVTIFVEDEFGGFQGTILSVEGNWLKVEEKKYIRLVNGDMISQIKVIK